jgi:hypothetical protein
LRTRTYTSRLQLDRSIDGVYTLEKQCGTASNSLHRRIASESDDQTPLYLFLDPTRSGEPSDDPFVFAANCDRLEYGDHRACVASLDTAWRPPTKAGKQSVNLVLPSLWSTLKSSKIVHGTADAADSTFSTLSTTFDLTADTTACSFADILLSAKVKQSAPVKALAWATPDWHEVDLVHEGPEVFSRLAWMLTKIPEWETFRDWQAISGKVRPSSSLSAFASAFSHVFFLVGSRSTPLAKPAAPLRPRFTGSGERTRRRKRPRSALSQSRTVLKPPSLSR